MGQIVKPKPEEAAWDELAGNDLGEVVVEVAVGVVIAPVDARREGGEVGRGGRLAVADQQAVRLRDKAFEVRLQPPSTLCQRPQVAAARSLRSSSTGRAGPATRTTLPAIVAAAL